MIERERKFELIGEIPLELICNSVDIEQVYTNSNVNYSPYNRIRKTIGSENTEYTHCTKYDIAEDNSREEIEFSISENQYGRILNLIDKNPIKKKRVFVLLPIQDECQKIAEVDFYEDGDVVIEVEFSNEEEMENFIIPDWFGLEILDKKNYSFFKIFSIE